MPNKFEKIPETHKKEKMPYFNAEPTRIRKTKFEDNPKADHNTTI